MLPGQKHQPLGHRCSLLLAKPPLTDQAWGSRLEKSFCLGNLSLISTIPRFLSCPIDPAFLLLVLIAGRGSGWSKTSLPSCSPRCEASVLGLQPVCAIILLRGAGQGSCIQPIRSLCVCVMCFCARCSFYVVPYLLIGSSLSFPGSCWYFFGLLGVEQELSMKDLAERGKEP